MNVTKTTKKDYIVEVLSRIIDFTSKREELINKNLKSIDNENYKPVDYDADEFSEVMANAVYHYIRSRKLVFKDALHTTFGRDGEIFNRICIDEKAQELFENDIDLYVKAQKKKLAENAMNQSIARQILCQYQAS